jgi:hypothetical protein
MTTGLIISLSILSGIYLERGRQWYKRIRANYRWEKKSNNLGNLEQAHNTSYQKTFRIDSGFNSLRKRRHPSTVPVI